MAGPTTTVRTEVLTCPACHQPIHADATMEVTVPETEWTRPIGATPPTKMTAEVTMVGWRIQHDCTPQVTRTTNHPASTPRG